MRWGMAGGLAAVLMLASACDRGASAPARSHDSADAGARIDRGASDSPSSPADSGGSYASHDDRYGERRGGGDEGGSMRESAREPVPMFKGEPMWADNRRHTAEENAKYHCDKSGPDIGAQSLDACLTKVHAFIDHPPSGVETLTRSNGDRLIYDPKANLFAVARKDGAPRTFFKPRDGAEYWKQQEDEVKSGGGYRRRDSGGEEGGAG